MEKISMQQILVQMESCYTAHYGRPLDGQPNNLFPEMIYPMVNGGVEEKNNMADNGMLIEISK